MAAKFVWTGAQHAGLGNTAMPYTLTYGRKPLSTAPGKSQADSNGGTSMADTDASDLGSLTIQDGSQQTYDGSDYTLDHLLVDGTGSAFTIVSSFSSLSVGDHGSGSIVATNGGKIIIGGHLFMGDTTGQTVIQVDANSSIVIGYDAAVAGAVTVSSFRSWTGIHVIQGAGTIAANLVNNYLVEAESAAGAPLEVTGAVSGNGFLYIDGGYGGILQLDGSVASPQTVEFGTFRNPGVPEMLRLMNPAAFAGSLYDFSVAGETLELVGQTVTDAVVDGSELIVSVADGGPFTFNLVHSGPPGLTFSGADVTVSDNVSCFMAGTRIRTQRGLVPVESLRLGDRVPVVQRRKPQPIVWLGRRHVDCSCHPNPKAVWPVCLSAGAFGRDRPFRDLWLSPDHALYIDDVLIPIRYLVNGTTVRQIARDDVTYWHVELPQHSVLYAEGVPAESYLDTGDRSGFANGGTVVDLHPDFAIRVWEAQGCAPLVVYGPHLAAAQRRLLARARAASITPAPHKNRCPSRRSR